MSESIGRTRACRAVAVGLLLSSLAARSAAAQSLGDVAREEEARRKTVKAPGKTYTNDGLRSEPTLPRASVPEASTSAATTPSAQAASGPAPEPKKDEAQWRARVKSARDSLDQSAILVDALQSRINALSADFTARDDPAQRSVVAADRAKALAEMDRVKKEVQDQTKALAAIQEEGRRANVPAGWLR